MARYLKRTGKSLYLDGLSLLSLCEKLMKEEPATGVPGGAGTAASPFTMGDAAAWITRWRASAKEAVVYYKLGGRLISKNQKMYVGDVGPAYLQGASNLESAFKAFRSRRDRLPKLNIVHAFAIDEVRKDINWLVGSPAALSMAATGTPPLTWTASVLATKVVAISKMPAAPSKNPLDYIAVDDQVLLKSWLGKNAIHDPTYQTGAQKIVDPGLIYEESTQHVLAYGGKRPAPWNDIMYSPSLAKAMRALLKGGAPSLTTDTGGYDRNYSRKQFMLPVFTMAIFHAEPARNPRAWPINLMLLDLAQAVTANFTWDAILWHPLAIPVAATTGTGRAVNTRIDGPFGPEANERHLVQITNTLKLHLVGGLLPASPTKGGEIGGKMLFQPAKPLTPQAIQHGAVQSPGSQPNTPFDYIHQKEIDVLLKWLMRFPDIRSHWSLYEDPGAISAADIISSNDVLRRASARDSPATTTGLMNIATRIQSRLRSLDFM